MKTMQTIENYCQASGIKCNPDKLDIGYHKNEYSIYEDSEPLLTPGGNLFSHVSEPFMRQILTDLCLSEGSSPANYPSPLFFAYQKDILGTGKDAFMAEWDSILGADRFFRMKTSGTPDGPAFGTHEELFPFSFTVFSGLVELLNLFISKVLSKYSIDEEEPNPFAEIIRHAYMGLPAEKKVGVQALGSAHQSGVVLPLLVIDGELTPADYVKGLIAFRICPVGHFKEALAFTASVLSYSGTTVSVSFPELNSGMLIEEGEGDKLEFKSTLRWDIRAGKTNPAIERSCLKTMAAFLNSSGGTLLIGVRDDGSTEGIETDKFPNDDKFLLHLWTLIRTCLGRDYAPYIKTRLEKKEERTICRVHCVASPVPVFLRQPGYPEEMYIRIGPSSNALDISEALKYIANHFR